MKLVCLVVIDPIAWKKSDVEWVDEDKEYFTSSVVRVGGLVVHETKDDITIGEISVKKDNSKLVELGVKYPRYRYIMTISKKCILHRQDFETKEFPEVKE